MRSLHSLSLMVALIVGTLATWGGQREAAGAARPTASAGRGGSFWPDHPAVGSPAASAPAKAAATRQDGGKGGRPAARKKTSGLAKASNGAQVRLGGSARPTPKYPVRQAPLRPYPSVQELLNKYPAAASIEVRVKSNKYAAAVAFYTRELTTMGITNPESNTYSTSWALPKDKPTTELIVVNFSQKIPGRPDLKRKAGTIGYIDLRNLHTQAEMAAYYSSIFNPSEFAIDSSEAPGGGSVGPRDVAKGTVRATFIRKSNALTGPKKPSPKAPLPIMLPSRPIDDEGVIINPPVP